MTYPLYKHMARTIDARLRCQQTENQEWFARHSETLRYIERNLLPSGSGIDSGTTIDLDKSTSDKIVLHTAFHHMDDGGGYDGWTEHTITVRPSLIHTIDLTIGGRDRNGIKEYLYDVFDTELQREYLHTYDKATEVEAFQHVTTEHHAAV